MIKQSSFLLNSILVIHSSEMKFKMLLSLLDLKVETRRSLEFSRLKVIVHPKPKTTLRSTLLIFSLETKPIKKGSKILILIGDG